MPRLVPRLAAAVALGAALAAGGCGPKVTYAPPDRVPVVRVHGTADPEITGVRLTTHFVADDDGEGDCGYHSYGLGRRVALEESFNARTTVEDGRFSVEAPLVWPEPSPCAFRATGLSTGFERAGREDDIHTERGTGVDLSGRGSTRKSPRLSTTPLPDTIRVACQLVGTLRPVLPPLAHCDRRPSDEGGYEDAPIYQANAGRPPRDLDVPMDVRYVPAFPDDTSARYDTTALKRAYGLD